MKIQFFDEFQFKKKNLLITYHPVTLSKNVGIECFKKLLKSLVTPNPKWTGFISYENKKGRYVTHSILKGKKI